MKITGSHTVRAPKERVWHALQDPATLARVIPGCQQLEVTGDGQYAATVWAGVASIKGTYSGTVEIADVDEPDAYTLKAAGKGGPGTVSAEARISLTENGDGHTEVSFEADAIIGGPIAGVGQRVVVGAARKTAGEFFANVERELTGAPAPAVAAPVAQPTAEAPAVGQVFAGTTTPPAVDMKTLLLAALAGALIALAGVWLGRRTAR
jgi:uncharacterized protein